MKHLGLSLIGLALSSTSLWAADLRVAPPPAPPPVFTPVPVFTWTGFYVGANAGYGFDVGQADDLRSVHITRDSNLTGHGYTNSNRDFSGVGSPFNYVYLPLDVNLPGQRKRSNSGFTGGLQIGGNYQFTPGSGFIVGAEADAQYFDAGRGKLATSGPFPAVAGNDGLTPPYTTKFTQIERLGEPNVTNGRSISALTLVNPASNRGGVEWFGTVRGRLGYAVDRTFFYGTGGFAYGGGGDSDRIRTGWTAGGGIEFALAQDSFLNPFRSSAVTLKLEALYVNLERAKVAGTLVYATDQSGNTYSAPVSAYTGGLAKADEFVVARASINYKF